MAQNTSVTWTKHIIASDVTGAKKNAVVNLDNDSQNLPDIVVTANPEGSSSEEQDDANVIWYRNGGNGVFDRFDIDLYYMGARGLAVGDLTGNGFADVVVGSKNADSSTVWYQNDGSPDIGSWPRINIGGPAPNNYSLKIADVNLDGNLDIVDGLGDDADSVGMGSGIFSDSLRWFENMAVTDTAVFETRLIASYSSPAGVAVADFDADLDNDIASTAWLNYSSLTPVTDEDMCWWENEADTAWTQSQVIQTAYGGNDLVAADVDLNGTIDLVGAGYKTKTLDWWSNDGTGNFSAIHVIASDFRYSRNVVVYDIDGDGDQDVCAAADSDNKISWFENDGSQNFTEHKVDSLFDYAYFVSASDLDGDGDVDFVGTAQESAELAWWENDLADEQIVSSGDPDAVNFNSDKLAVDFRDLFSGGNTSAFFNHGKNDRADQVGLGLDHIAESGYYTIVTDAADYIADCQFFYGDIGEWAGVATLESDLRICVWDDTSGTAGEWIVLGDSGQVVDEANDRIIVAGLIKEFERYSRFTIGSVSTVSSIFADVRNFNSSSEEYGVRLSWLSETDEKLSGFEIMRKSADEDDYILQASYTEDENLRVSTSNESYSFLDRFVEYGGRYNYKLLQVDVNGNRHEHSQVSVDYIPGDAIKIFGLHVPQKMALYQNFPNPFNSSTNIEFSVPAGREGNAAQVNLTIYNVLGQQVKSLFNGQISPGNYLMRWDGNDAYGRKAASGQYIYRLKVAGKVMVKKLTLLN